MGLQGSTLTAEEEEQWRIAEKLATERTRIRRAINTMVDDKVKPNYYKAEGYELDVLDIIEMFNLGFHEGCIIKYLIRWEDKGGIQDLRKAKEYIERMIEWKSTKG